jgi:hypothetical protein
MEHKSRQRSNKAHNDLFLHVYLLRIHTHHLVFFKIYLYHVEYNWFPILIVMSHMFQYALIKER